MSSSANAASCAAMNIFVVSSARAWWSHSRGSVITELKHLIKPRIRPICYWLLSLKALEILTCKQRQCIWASNYPGWMVEMRNIVKYIWHMHKSITCEDVMKSCEICHIITGQLFQAHVWKCHQVNMQVFKATSHDWCCWHLDIFSLAKGLISKAIQETLNCCVLHPQRGHNFNFFKAHKCLKHPNKTRLDINKAWGILS